MIYMYLHIHIYIFTRVLLCSLLSSHHLEIIELSTRRYFTHIELGITGVCLSSLLSRVCAVCCVFHKLYPIDRTGACVVRMSEVAPGSGFFLCSASTGSTSLSPVVPAAACNRYIHAPVLSSHLSLYPPCPLISLLL